MNGPLEAKLRPAYEWLPAITSLSVASVLAWKPAYFIVDSPLGACTIGGLLLHGVLRTQQALDNGRFRRNLTQPRSYAIRVEDIPVDDKRLFLGRGFRWDQRHTQRLWEARQPKNEHLVGPPWWMRRLFPGKSHTPVAEAIGGDPRIHGVEPEEIDIWMDLAERVGHTLVLGTTRVGKTRLAEILITQDIRRGEVVIVFDPKGDLDLLRRIETEAARAGRAGELYVFHLGHPERSARYNPVGSFSRVTEVATRIAGQLPSEGQSAAFRQFVWRYVNVMTRALVALSRKPDYAQIGRYASNIEPLLIDYYEHWLDGEPEAVGWRDAIDQRPVDRRNLDKGLQSRGERAVALVQYAKERGLFDPIGQALATTLSYEKSYFDKLVASLLPLMEKLSTGAVAELLSPTEDPKDSRPVFDWASVIAVRGIVYVGLDALSDYEVAAAVGNAMFADLTSVAGGLYKHGTGRGLPGDGPPRRIALHADEFNELIGDEFIPLLNKAGGAGFQVTAYTQTWSDVEARIGSRPKAGQIAGNFNTLIMLRVKELATAELLTAQLPTVQVLYTVASSSVSDTNDPGEFTDFASRNDDGVATETVPLVAPSDLVQLPKGQAFALLHGGHLHKLRIPLPVSEGKPATRSESGASEKSRRAVPGMPFLTPASESTTREGSRPYGG